LWNAFPNVFGPFENNIKQPFDTLKSQGLDTIFLLVLCHALRAILEASRRHRLLAWMWAQRILLLPSAAQMVDLW
jgi:hypothetical protein